MQIVISAYHDSATCTWCNRTVEGVTAEFDGGFLQKGPLCWRCLQQATRVHHAQSHDENKPAAKPRAPAVE
jgi:hypothetical protein